MSEMDGPVKLLLSNITAQHDKLNKDFKQFSLDQKQINENIVNAFNSLKKEYLSLVEIIREQQTFILKILERLKDGNGQENSRVPQQLQRCPFAEHKEKES